LLQVLLRHKIINLLERNGSGREACNKGSREEGATKSARPSGSKINCRHSIQGDPFEENEEKRCDLFYKNCMNKKLK